MRPAESHLDRALQLARDDAPPPLDTVHLERLVATAVAANRLAGLDDALEDDFAPTAEPRRGRLLRWSAIVAAVAAAFVIGFWSGHSPGSAPVASGPDAEPHAEVAPAHTELPGGDRLTISAGADYVVGGTTTARDLRLRSGSLLVDARPRRAGESLSVRTRHGTVRVVGTVFTVSVDADQTRVRVHEGRVVVRWENEELVLGAGGAVAVGEAGFRPAPPPSTPEAQLAEAAVSAVQRRARAAPAPHATPSSAAGTLDSPPPLALPRPTGAARELGNPAGALPTAPASDGRPPRPAFARLWIADGQSQRALDAARRALAEGQHEPTWRMVEGEALHALGRPGEAVMAYEQAAASYGPALAARAALAAAELRFAALDDPRGAWRTLERYGASAEPQVQQAIEALREELRAAMDRASTPPSASSSRGTR